VNGYSETNREDELIRRAQVGERLAFQQIVQHHFDYAEPIMATDADPSRESQQAEDAGRIRRAVASCQLINAAC
jgi:hypothetical protein